MAKPGRIFWPVDVNWYEEWGHKLSDDAALLWVVAGCACKRMTLDGHLTMSQIRRAAPESLAESPARLNAAVTDLCSRDEFPWTRDETGVVFKGWSEWNDLAAEIAAMSEGGKFGNHVKWHVKKNKPSLECEFCNPIAPESPPISPPISGPESKSREDTDVDTDAELVARRTSPEAKAPKSTRTRAPESFPVDDELRQWARDHGLGAVDLDAETEHFLNHHGAKGTLMVDWRKAWFTWMGRVPQFRREPGRTAAPARPPVSDRNRDRIRAAADAIRATEDHQRENVAQIGAGR